jgi:putative endopeptidase
MAPALATDSDVAGLHLDWLDKSIDPAVDFYTYANGGWMKANPIPPGYPSWNLYYKRFRENQEILHGILEKLAQDPQLKPGSYEQKAGDFYASGMDLKAVESAGISPLAPEFQRIAAIHDQSGLQADIARLQMMGVVAGFGFGEMQDPRDSRRVIAYAAQGGIGLPDRDYYLETTELCPTPDAACNTRAEGYRKVRVAYLDHMAKVFALAGDMPAKAAAEAKAVMGIETALARASLSDVDQRDPEKIYHLEDIKALDAATPGFSWEAYLAAMGSPEVQSVDLQMPDFFKAFGVELSAVGLDDWKTYLRWQLLDALAPYLSAPYVEENAGFGAVITGAHEASPRWQQVMNAAAGSQENYQTFDAGMGYVLGKLYVDQVFPPSSRQQVLGILHGIRAALRSDLQTLAWMSPATRQAAIKKLDLMGERIGYPDKWPDYSSLHIRRQPYVLNVIAVREYFQRSELAKIGKPVDKGVWNMLPQTVNADYEPTLNNINFPAGILQPPFFDPGASTAANYGNIGQIIGHEMTHGFDDQGALYDGDGNLLPGSGWWSPEDFAKFKAATDCIATQFSGYTVVNGLHLQGKLVTGEATADLGGAMLAWRAFHASPEYAQAKTIAGFTPDQQFFLSAAHQWPMNKHPEQALRDVTSNPHPPGKPRINGTFANMPQFQQAFHLPDSSPMVNKDRCVIW